MSKRSRRAASGDPTRAGSGATPAPAPGKPSTPGTAATASASAAKPPASGAATGGAGSAATATAGGAAAGSATTRTTRPTTPPGQVPGAFGNRRAAQRGETGSSSPTGTPRAGRRAQPLASDRSFVDRNRRRLIWGAIVAGVLAIVAFVLVSSSQPVYACSIQIDAAASPAPGSSIVGQPEDDMGRGHVAVGTPVTYTYCPPASGRHYNAAGQGPIQPRFYGPEDTTIPQGWIHNLEHGGLVILYNCNRGGCDANSLAELKQLASNFPTSPRCGIAGGRLSPVITRFDTMKTGFAALVWGRVLMQDKLDTAQMLEFFKNVGETTNPEQQCNPNASASPGVTSNPLGPDATNPAANPADTGTPGASAAPSGT